MNQEFAENIKNHIREYLPVDYQDAKITLEKVTKGNDRILTGLIIRKDDETAVPSIYLEHYEEQFGKGRPMDDIMKEIAQIKMENSLELPIDVKGLQDYETARPLLAIRLCDPEKNQEYLKDKPHTACGELAATYRIQIMEDSSGTASAVVTNDMLNLWGITPEQLHHDTVSAENARNPVCLYTMDDVMSEIMLSVKPENLFEQTEALESEMIPRLSIVENPKPSRNHYGTWMGSQKQPSHQEQLRWAIDAALEEKPKDFEELLKKLEAAGIEVNQERKYLRFRLSPEDRYTRCDTLKGDYTEQAIRERIAGIRTVKPRRISPQKPVSKVGLLVDIEAAVRSGKGPGYERWAKVFNLKQLSQAVIYLKEHGDMSYED